MEAPFDPDHIAAFFDHYGEREWELRLCREPGVLDGGTHIVVALRTPAA